MNYLNILFYSLVPKLQPIYIIFQRHIELLCEMISQKHPQIYNSNFKDSAIEFFSCIQHLISWIKLDSLVTENFLDNLFRLATLYFTVSIIFYFTLYTYEIY